MSSSTGVQLVNIRTNHGNESYNMVQTRLPSLLESISTSTPEGIYPTQTPYPTQTTYPTQTSYPTQIVMNDNIIIPQVPGGERSERLLTGYEWARLSYYYPPYGGINCDENCEDLADGNSFRTRVGYIVACPSEFEFGTVFVIMDREWICQDRGSEIVRLDDGSIWLDMLYPVMPYNLNWGDIVQVGVIRP